MELIGFAKRLDPDLTDDDFADAGQRLDQLSDRRFTEAGLSPHDVGRLRERLAEWPHEAAHPGPEPEPGEHADPGRSPNLDPCWDVWRNPNSRA